MQSTVRLVNETLELSCEYQQSNDLCPERRR